MFAFHDEVNDQAQRLYRYKLYLLSNFLTDFDGLAASAGALDRLIADAMPGAVFLVIGATCGHYPSLYSKIYNIFARQGADNLLDQTIEEQIDVDEAELRVVRSGWHGLWQHLEALAGTLDHKGLHDVWSLDLVPGDKGDYRRLCFRKGRWPIGRLGKRSKSP